MLKFFSIILNKKTFAVLFLLLIFLGLLIPRISNAGFFDWLFSNNCAPDDVTNMTPEQRAEAIRCLRGENAKLEKIDKGLGAVEETLNSLTDLITIPFAATVLAICAIIVSIVSGIAALSASIFSLIFAATTNMGCYTCMENPVVAAGWPRMRDLANMVVVLGFIIIGISTALRFREYEAKKLLPKLIIAAILINFSLLICGIVIDGSNILSKYFLKSGGFFATSWIESIGNQINIIWNAYHSANSYLDSAIEVLKATAGIIFYCIMAIIVFLLYAFLYIFRVIALWILVILSPLAFVFYVFPATKKFFDMWWNNFLGWSIIIVPISFFVWLSDKIIGEFKGGDISIFAYLIPGSLMLLGFVFSLQFSAMGASAAISAFKKTGNMSVSAIKNSRVGEKINREAVRAGEKMGLITPGTSNMMRQKQLQANEVEKKIAAATKEERADSAFFSRTPMTRRGRNAKYESIKQSFEKGEARELLESGKITQSQYDNALAFYKSHGGSLSALAEKDYFVAGYGKTGVAAQQARNAQLSENISKGMTGKQLRSISPNDINITTNPDSHDIIKDQFTPAIARQFKTADPRLKAALRSHIGDTQTAGTLRHDAATATDPREATRLTKLADALDKATT